MFPKVVYGSRREMMPQRVIVKHRRNKAGRHKTGGVALVSDRERKCMERPTHWSSVTLQGLHKSHLFTVHSLVRKRR